VGQGISEVLTFAIGVAISPIPIIAVILMLFSRRARINVPVFLLGWVLALAALNVAAYVLAQASDPAASSSANDTISWGKIALGVVLLLLGVRNWRSRPRAGSEPAMPKWMASVDALMPWKALGLGLLLAGLNPKKLILTIGAAAGLAQLGLSTTDAVVSLIVFVLVAASRSPGRRCTTSSAGRRRRPRSTRSRTGWASTTQPSRRCCCWCSGST